MQKKNPEVISRMYNEGHELANHTFTHPLRTNVPNLLKEIKQTDETIQKKLLVLLLLYLGL